MGVLTVCKNVGRRPGESYHVIRRIAMLRSELATKMRQALTENKIKRKEHI